MLTKTFNDNWLLDLIQIKMNNPWLIANKYLIYYSVWPWAFEMQIMSSQQKCFTRFTQLIWSNWTNLANCESWLSLCHKIWKSLVIFTEQPAVRNWGLVLTSGCSLQIPILIIIIFADKGVLVMQSRKSINKPEIGELCAASMWLQGCWLYFMKLMLNKIGPIRCLPVSILWESNKLYSALY